ncbi:MAG: GTPase Era [Bacteroidia bacterium]|nr:GTPase Era [Bacteroidia bacterium]
MDSVPKNHKSGFVNIIGKPNVGKSTLMNALIGERLSIINRKPQTTRHRILAILSDENFQIVFSDTPGFIDDPAYQMQEEMNKYVKGTFEDADIFMVVIEVGHRIPLDHSLLQKLKLVKVPLFLVLNKTDLYSDKEILSDIQYWSEHLNPVEIFPVSALNKKGTDKIVNLLLQYLPEGPAYYPKDQLTDRSERFFVSEIIREKCLSLYKQELPYSIEIVVTRFKHGTSKKGPIIFIDADIYTDRQTQKSIIIGKHGQAIKRLGSLARKDIEAFLDSRVHLELRVKVKEGWRNNQSSLKRFGY